MMQSIPAGQRTPQKPQLLRSVCRSTQMKVPSVVAHRSTGHSHLPIPLHTDPGMVQSETESSTMPLQSLSALSQTSGRPGRRRALLSSQSLPPQERGGSPSLSPSSRSTRQTLAAGSQRSRTVQGSMSAQSAVVPQARPATHPRRSSQVCPAPQRAASGGCRHTRSMQRSSVHATPSSHSELESQPGSRTSDEPRASDTGTVSKVASEVEAPSWTGTPGVSDPHPAMMSIRMKARRLRDMEPPWRTKRSSVRADDGNAPPSRGASSWRWSSFSPGIVRPTRIGRRPLPHGLLEPATAGYAGHLNVLRVCALSSMPSSATCSRTITPPAR